jgi:hypothetical protein
MAGVCVVRGWILQQYNDIRGNFKWALLGGLYWLIVHYGKPMLQLIPHISPWMVHAIILLLALVAFVVVAKMNRPIQQPSVQAGHVGAAPMPTLSGLYGQAPQITFDAKDYFLHAYFSPVTSELENNIKIIAHREQPQNVEDFYARFIGVGAVSYMYEVLWLRIFKSQFLMLLETNHRNGWLSASDARVYYDNAVPLCPKLYPDYTLDGWLQFLIDERLLFKHPSNMLEITQKGKDFLKYAAHWGWVADSRVC